MKTKDTLLKLHWILSSQFGFDIRRFLNSLHGLPQFISDWRQFRRDYTGRLTLMPCLHDRFEEGGDTKNEYFWQDLLVARWIYEAKPERHVDVGSRIEGFVAHVASFRKIEVFDVRSITSQVPGVVFRQADLMNLNSVHSYAGMNGYCDSLSCLHALEHFGLGRYGDPIDLHGYKRGISNLSKLLKSGGVLYLSVPMGKERVDFNANWVFDPHKIIRYAKANGLEIQTLVVLSGTRKPLEVFPDEDSLDKLAAKHYNLVLLVFTKSKWESHNHV